MGYIKTSTENPLGKRPFNAQLTQPVIPNHGFRLNGLGAYYPANYFVPTPCNITMAPQANIGMGDLGDFINNVQWLRPGQWRSRDNDYSPIPRIYLPPELANQGLGFLNADATFDFLELARKHPRFSGGPIPVDPSRPGGFFFPRTLRLPRQFATGPNIGWNTPVPDPGDPRGHYFPRTPYDAPPAWLRVRSSPWSVANPAGLGALGIASPPNVRSISSALPRPTPVPRPVAPIIVVGKKPVAFAPKPVAVTPQPIVRTRPVGISPSGRPITTNVPPVTPSPVYTPGTAPTYPPNANPIGGGMCSVTSSPETGSVVSVEQCQNLPGYQAGTAPSVTYPPPPYPLPGYPLGPVPVGAMVGAAPPARPWPILLPTSTALSTAQSSAAAGTLTQMQLSGLSAAQQQALINTNNQALAAQQAGATQAAAGGGGVATDGTTAAAPDSSAADVLGWLSQSTLITGVPNWVIAGGGGLAVLWLMNRKK